MVNADPSPVARGSTFTRASSTTRVGIFYALHHCYTLNKQRNAMRKRYGPSGDYGERVLDVHAIEGDPAQAFGPHLAKHYWAEPQLGYYCLSERRDVLEGHKNFEPGHA